MKYIIGILMVIIVLGAVGCSSKVEKKDAVSDLKSTACNQADSVGTCFTKLPELGLIMPEECCQTMGKCCTGDEE